ncbi:hypothetical protein PsalMR5_00900 [Piscirickettsia salmonis]|nr:hypothetical protein PsalSR1_00899 [Piscirickettsia salmonis]QGP60595.1 hypothetical protein PsalBI1_03211 [Piscirickettsia salmonis]QGP63054.1 hypothetical protein PsalMR5_00900 [Piscirickettsia salmonis]
MRYLAFFLAVILLVSGCASTVPTVVPYSDYPHVYACPNKLSTLCYRTAIAPVGHWSQYNQLSFQVPIALQAPLRQGKLELQEYYAKIPVLPLSGPGSLTSYLYPFGLYATKIIRLENLTDQRLDIVNVHVVTRLQQSQSLLAVLNQMQAQPAHYFGNSATESVKLLASGTRSLMVSGGVGAQSEPVMIIYMLVDLKLYNGNQGYLLYSLARKSIGPTFVLNVEQKLFSENKPSLKKLIMANFFSIKQLVSSVNLVS